MEAKTIQNGKAITVKTRFSRETEVGIKIEASPAIIWALLTNAADYPRWNTTVLSLEGSIKMGETIKLKSTLDAKRTFKLKVKEIVPNKRMVWAGGQGSRVYTLTENSDGSTTFCMNEKIGGLMFPLYAKYIPSFDDSFATFASNLKAEAEKINSVK
jgi:uncharacterized protein YndB with AHSA1/START domain